MRVLSLFDGMACGMIAMQMAGVEVESYDAYEIDKYAVKTATHNFPMIREHGDVFAEDFTKYREVDWLIGGSPCTYWSIAQTQNRETEASGMGWELFSQYVRALHEAQPRYFIYENNKSMSKAIRASIDRAFGFEAVGINSALVSAQNRQRLYWVGKRNPDGAYSKVPVEQPEDLGILLKDVLDGAERIPSYGPDDKSRPVRMSYANKGAGEGSLKTEAFPDNPAKQVSDYAAVPVAGRVVGRRINEDGHRDDYNENLEHVQRYEVNDNPGKTNCLTTVSKDNMIAEPINATETGKAYAITAHQGGRTVANFMNGGGHYPQSGVAEPVPTVVQEQLYGRKARPDGSYDRRYEARRDDKSGTLTQDMRFQSVAEPINTTAEGKSGTLRATCYKDGIRNLVANDVDRKTGVAEPVPETDFVPFVEKKLDKAVERYGYIPEMWNPYNNSEITEKTPTITASCSRQTASSSIFVARNILQYATAVEWDSNGHPTKAISGADGKTYTVYTVADGRITIKDKQYPIKLIDGYYIIRKLTVSECKRLQTVPDWYDFSCVSATQAYRMLGNGWTCKVISWIIKSCLREER